MFKHRNIFFSLRALRKKIHSSVIEKITGSNVPLNILFGQIEHKINKSKLKLYMKLWLTAIRCLKIRRIRINEDT